MKPSLLTGFAAVVIAGSLFAADPLVPDPKLTPGAVVTNVPVEVVLAHGYTASVRNGVKVRNVPDAVVREVYRRYGLARQQGHYEVDHSISLELGGSNSISNLWPQSYLTYPWNAKLKDRLENRLASLARVELAKNGRVAAAKLLAQFQSEISTNWTNCYAKHVGKP